MNFFKFIVSILIGSIGSYLFFKLKIPSSAMLGALFAVALFNVTTNQAFFYPSLRALIQISSGTIIGSRLRRKNLQKLYLLKIPILFLLGSMLIYNFIFGLLVYSLSDLDIATSMLAIAPGGTSDLTIIAPELGGDATIIAMIHSCRILVIYTLIPIIMNRYRIKNILENTSLTENKINIQNENKSNLKYYDLIIPLLLAAIFGIIFSEIGIKAGMIIGAMCGSALFSYFRREFSIPPLFTKIVRIFAGTFVGVKFTKEIFAAASKLFLPIVIMIIGLIVLMNVTPRIIRKVSKIPYIACLLASAPGGLQEMTLIADDYDKEYVSSVAILQTLRLVFLLITSPIIITVMTKLFTFY